MAGFAPGRAETNRCCNAWVWIAIAVLGALRARWTRPAPRRVDQRAVDRHRGRLHLRPGLPVLQRVDRSAGASRGRDARHARRAPDNGRDFVPTHRWVVFGHHFAAIAGAGPLVGPTLATQFGYLPGTLWLLVGAVLGGCVQDMTILFLSTRRNGRSLGQMARDELGPIGGTAALLGTLADHGHPDRRARARDRQRDEAQPLGHLHRVRDHSRSRSSSAIYMRHWRPGRVLEGSLLGVALLLARRGRAAAGSITIRPCGRCSTRPALPLAGFVIAYGWIAAILPVWLLLAPRDYLSTFLKLGMVVLLAIAILLMHPEIKMPALTPVHRRHRPDLRRQDLSRSCSSPSPAARSPASMRWSRAAPRRS